MAGQDTSSGGDRAKILRAVHIVGSRVGFRLAGAAGNANLQPRLGESFYCFVAPIDLDTVARRRVVRRAVAVFLVPMFSALAGCAGDISKLPAGADIGPSPTLPPPSHALLPTMQIAPATGWTDGAKPVAAPGLSVNAFAADLDHPRWLYVLPNGDVLVAETNAPPKPDDAKGVRGLVQRFIMARAGAGVPSANRITLLRDTGSGAATKSVFLKDLNSPFGMTLV